VLYSAHAGGDLQAAQAIEGKDHLKTSCSPGAPEHVFALSLTTIALLLLSMKAQFQPDVASLYRMAFLKRISWVPQSASSR